MTTINLLYQIALQRFERGAFRDAEQLLLQITQQTPEHVEAAHLLARSAVERRRFNRALELLGPVTAALPDHPKVLETLGRAHLGAGRPDEAITCFERALQHHPDNGRLHGRLSDAHLALRHFDRARLHAEEAIQLTPTDAEVHASLGNVYLETRQAAAAIACYDRSLELSPDSWQVFANRGMAYLVGGDLEEAKASLTFANALNPMESAVVLPLAGVLIDSGDHREANLILEKLSAMMPQNPAVLRYSGINALKQGKPQAAVRDFIKAVSIDDTDAELKLQLGDALMKEGKVDNAITLFTNLVASQPAFLPAHALKAKAALSQGRLKEGFDTIEAMQAHVTTGLEWPRWQGEPVDGKTVLLYSQLDEESLNLFIRFAEPLKARGATVVVECAPPAQRLLSGMASVDNVIGPERPTPPIDYHAPVETLPGSLGMDAESAFPKAPYLAPNPESAARLAPLFDDPRPFKIGLMWRRESDLRPDFYRSVPLTAFAPLAALDDIALFSLQTDCGKEELEGCDFGKDIRHLDVLENVDLAERLDALPHLDLLISADTLTAQVAAAADRPVWILTSTAPEWHLGQTGAHSPWLPSARLFRQSVVGEWDTVVSAVVEALRQLRKSN